MAKFLSCGARKPGGKIAPVMHMRTLQRVLAMSPEAWEATIRALQLAVALLFGAWLLLLDAGTYTAAEADSYSLARELVSLTQAVLLIGVLAGALIEERRAP